MTTYGYARTSRADQRLDLQRAALERAGCDRIVTEQLSGATVTKRPQLQQLLARLGGPGDKLVVWRLDRLGRSIRDLIAIVEDLAERGVEFASVQESIDTGTPGGRLVFHLFGALAEFERGLIRERTVAGLEAARAKGRIGGRRPKLTSGERIEALELVERGEPIRLVAERFGVDRSTIYRLAGCREKKMARDYHL